MLIANQYLICKVMEHILGSHIIQRLEEHDTLLPSQFGCWTQHSCESQLLIVTDDCKGLEYIFCIKVCNKMLPKVRFDFVFNNIDR